MPYALVDDIHLYYTEQPGPMAGAPTVVFLHGLGSSSDDWALQVPAFSRRFRVLAVDLRGHGRSERGRGPYTLERLADDVAALLAQHGQGPAHVVGLSLGGCVALSLAVRHPQCVRALVLVNTFARLRPAGLRGLWRFAQRMWLLAFAPMPAMAALVAAGLFPRPDQRAYYEAAVASLSRNRKRTYLDAVRAVARFNARRRLRAVRCPTLVVAGDCDQTVPRAAAEALAAGIPGAVLHIVADSGHATPIDQMEVFNAVVLRFLEGK